MIVQQQQDSVEVIGTDFTSTSFGINEKSLGMFFKSFTDSLYSDKIGSIVREITSNCYDSHREAGVNFPVTIKLERPFYGSRDAGQIVFTDYGVGISPERMTNIYAFYFSSTKRTSNNEIGGFGIGAKSPLAYTESFIIQTVFNKVQYTYVIRRGVQAPTIDLIQKEATTERNGTKVKIDIKNDRDYQLFVDAIKNQLRFFDNLVIDAQNLSYKEHNLTLNDYKIYQGKHFIVRSNDAGRKGGVCLGAVYYPLNYAQIDEYEDDFKTPICLKVNIGDIDVTLNRESIEYNERTVAFLKKKMQQAKEELTEIYRDQSKEYTDILEYIKCRDLKPFVRFDGYSFSVQGYVSSKVTSIFKPFAGLPMKMPHDPFLEYKFCEGVVDGEKKKNLDNHFGRNLTILKAFEDGYPIYRLSDALGKRKNIYISEITPGNKFLTISMAKMEDRALARILDCSTQPEDIQKKCIETYRRVILEFVVKHSVKYETVQIPEEWMKNYLKNLNIRKSILNSKEEVIAFVPDLCSGYRQAVTTLGDLGKIAHRRGGLVIYGDNKDEIELRRVRQVLVALSYVSSYEGPPSENYPMYICRLSKTNCLQVKGNDGFIHVSDFIEKYKKIFARAYYIDKLGNLRYSLNIIKNTLCQRYVFNNPLINEILSLNHGLYLDDPVWLKKMMEYYNLFDIDVYFKNKQGHEISLREFYIRTKQFVEAYEVFIVVNEKYKNLSLPNEILDKAIDKLMNYTKINNLKFHYYAKPYLRCP